MSKAILVAGLGFGDEGKGTITQYLASEIKADMVVRYNGGAQAAHNVYAQDGRHHTFSQFGSATFEGVPTFISRHVIVDPAAFMKEEWDLYEKGMKGAYKKVLFDRNALVVTPFHSAANRLREILRGDGKHGSCGMGIGETKQDSLSSHNDSVTMGDLSDKATLLRKFKSIQERKYEEFKSQVLDVSLPDVAHRALRWFTFPTERVEHMAGRLHDLKGVFTTVDSDDLPSLLHGKNLVFEGAQGALLDQDYGFQPYTAWTDATFTGARQILDAAGYDGDIWKVGVMRSYMTRHGAGPFPTHDQIFQVEEGGIKELVLDRHNGTGLWQGSFRVGAPDVLMTRYALDVVGGVDEIAMTHIDQRHHFDWIGVGYAVHDEEDEPFFQFGSPSHRALDIHIQKNPTYAHQQRLAEALTRVAPCYERAPKDTDGFLHIMKQHLQTPIGIISTGCEPSKKFRP